MTSTERPASSTSPSKTAGRLAVWAALWRSSTERMDAQTAAASNDALRLPRPPGVFRLFFARHLWILDWAVVAVFALPAAGYLVGAFVTGRNDVAALVAASVAALALIVVTVALRFRRAHPLVLVAAVGLSFVAMGSTFGGSLLPAALFGLYGAAVYASVRAAWISFGALALILATVTLISTGVDLAETTGMSLTFGFLMLVFLLIGVNVGNRKRYVEALLDRATQLVRERDQQALLAAANERARIAREMHDIVAHSLTVMVALADGADVSVERSPERARDAIRQVAETGRTALADMRVVLGVLAEPHGGPVAAVEPVLTGPQPSHNDLAALVNAYRSAGMVIRFSVSGAVPLDAGLELTVFRIVQEALTNSLRYAPDPKHAAVSIVYSSGGVSIVVDDEGQSETGAPSIGTGKGLIGMRERAAAYGGTVEAGHTNAGGWRVRATLSTPDTKERS
ncbi:sensor histidine kinase [Subtercola vilae]|nr:histidine kinase [Subtercola vilae]